MTLSSNVYVYIALMWLFTYLLRALPLLLIRRPIKNVFIRSFLHYTPYVTLSVMTFPAITQVTQTPISGFCAFFAGIAAAWIGWNLFEVAAACSVVVFGVELLLC